MFDGDKTGLIGPCGEEGVPSKRRQTITATSQNGDSQNGDSQNGDRMVRPKRRHT